MIPPNRFIVRAGQPDQLLLTARRTAEKLHSSLSVDLVGVSTIANAVCLRLGGIPNLHLLRGFTQLMRQSGYAISPDRPMQRSGAQPLHLLTPRLLTLRKPVRFLGRGVGIAIIDKHGVASHADFGTRLKTFVFMDQDYHEGAHHPADGENEGTHVASVAAGEGPSSGAAPAASIFAYKAEYEFEMIMAIEAALKHPQICVVATAWSLSKNNDEEPGALAKAVATARDSNVVMLAAAGNRGTDQGAMQDPALMKDTFAVGAFVDGENSQRAEADENDKVARDSSRGPSGRRKPDFLEFYGAYSVRNASGSTGAAPGTSMSVARAAGVIATWYEAFGGRAKLPVSTVEQILQHEGSCIRLKNAGLSYRSNEQGLGALSEEACEKRVVELTSP